MTTAKSHLGSATHSYAQAVLDYFEQRGEDPVNVFGDGLVKHIRLGAAAERLSISQWQDMLQDAARHLSDPAFPLRPWLQYWVTSASTLATGMSSSAVPS
jgi:hypothetical protein